MNILSEIKTKDRLHSLYPLLEEACEEVSAYMHGEFFPPEIFALISCGDLKAWEIGSGEGICFCSQEQGILYINAFYLKPGAPRGMMRCAGLELAREAKRLGLQEARFKTQRPAGFKKALAEIGYQPRCVEFAISVETLGESSEAED